MFKKLLYGGMVLIPAAWSAGNWVFLAQKGNPTADFAVSIFGGIIFLAGLILLARTKKSE